MKVERASGDFEMISDLQKGPTGSNCILLVLNYASSRLSRLLPHSNCNLEELNENVEKLITFTKFWRWSPNTLGAWSIDCKKATADSCESFWRLAHLTE